MKRLISMALVAAMTLTFIRHNVSDDNAEE
ncbi:hypothetical protein UYO_0076 [Lachnospiraceae bacterium JC7]|nr:hypothetical protein UYO_0076 [Lachnospiraceae bacterium JC7]